MLVSNQTDHSLFLLEVVLVAKLNDETQFGTQHKARLSAVGVHLLDIQLRVEQHDLIFGLETVFVKPDAVLVRLLAHIKEVLLVVGVGQVLHQFEYLNTLVYYVEIVRFYAQNLVTIKLKVKDFLIHLQIRKNLLQLQLSLVVLLNLAQLGANHAIFVEPINCERVGLI